MPCPQAGSISSGFVSKAMRLVTPRRFSPADANTNPSNSPESNFAKRVPKLPRTGDSFKSGRNARIWAIRRKLEVPRCVPYGMSEKSVQDFVPIRCTNASVGVSRAVRQHKSRPTGSSMGTSFNECTARSARPSYSAVSNSFTKTPFPPTLVSDTSRCSSPSVEISRSLIVVSG